MADRKVTQDWRGKARRAIKKRYAAALVEVGMNARLVERYITQGYAEYAGTDKRMKYPYRAWRQELNKVMEAHKLREVQLTLFDLVALEG